MYYLNLITITPVNENQRCNISFSVLLQKKIRESKIVNFGQQSKDLSAFGIIYFIQYFDTQLIMIFPE